MNIAIVSGKIASQTFLTRKCCIDSTSVSLLHMLATDFLPLGCLPSLRPILSVITTGRFTAPATARKSSGHSNGYQPFRPSVKNNASANTDGMLSHDEDGERLFTRVPEVWSEVSPQQQGASKYAQTIGLRELKSGQTSQEAPGKNTINVHNAIDVQWHKR